MLPPIIAQKWAWEVLGREMLGNCSRLYRVPAQNPPSAIPLKEKCCGGWVGEGILRNNNL